MNILNYRVYYFLGVGGIGMSALARYFRHYHKAVFGYDKTATPLSREIEREGIFCHYEENVKGLQIVLSKYEKEEVLVVYTPAVPQENAEYQWLLENGYTIMKRAQVLGEITKQFRTIAIAGTHGKTTTTTLVTHILRTAGINCYSFMGGISRNYNSNLLFGDPTDKDAYVVVEADEFDRSFLTLHPYIAVITSSDADHLDIYGDAAHVKESYSLFARQVAEKGTLIVKKSVDNELDIGRNKVIYSLNLDTEYCAGSITVEKAQYSYDIITPVEEIKGVKPGIPGLHNIENSIAATAVAQQLLIKGSIIKRALRSFKGVQRRFDYRVRSKKAVYIDDYAHHPEELRATINSVRQLYPDKKVTGIFQPHLFTRTRDFGDDFARSLDLLDECILLEIYPAREKPIPGISSQWLLDKMTIADKRIMTKDGILEEMKKGGREVILTMGAGDIDTIIEPLEKILT